MSDVFFKNAARWGTSLLLASSLAACGGGGVDELVSTINEINANTPAKYRLWEGNSNKDSIQDGNQDFYLVENSTGLVVHEKSKMQMTGMTVNNFGTVFHQGTTFGYVVLVESTTAGKIAIFSCVNGNRMKIVTDTVAKKYTLNC